MRLEDRQTLLATAFDELPAEPRLPDPGRSRDPDDPPAARQHLRERRIERRDLALASDEAREAARPEHVEPAPQVAEPRELEYPHRRAHALHLVRSEIDELEQARDQRRGVLGDEHASGRRQLLHARGEPDRVALRRVRRPLAVADPAADHLARVEPDAHGQLELTRGA
ncbi:MAG TPA: hypothetical protein VKA21_06195 [Candidatus Binatia bacterium]|nr:hypothetical protein [Candidatus Binatia bacterium]